MLRLLPLAFSLMSSDLEAAVARRKRNGMLVAAAVFLLVSAWALLLTAAVAWTAQAYGLPAAAGAAAALLAALALCVMAVLSFLKWRDRKQAEKDSPGTRIAAYAALGAAPLLQRKAGLLGLGLAVALAFAASQMASTDAGDD
ncbi:hypothetical protein ACLB6G_00995 [Zhengella sp. ZM62]|uniref:hypothetical protein n=1 Tax=Zhengella sedimenti TaxID=3390035 RepID=UPI003975B1C5